MHARAHTSDNKEGLLHKHNFSSWHVAPCKESLAPERWHLNRNILCRLPQWSNQNITFPPRWLGHQTASKPETLSIHGNWRESYRFRLSRLFCCFLQFGLRLGFSQKLFFSVLFCSSTQSAVQSSANDVPVICAETKDDTAQHLPSRNMLRAPLSLKNITQNFCRLRALGISSETWGLQRQDPQRYFDSFVGAVPSCYHAKSEHRESLMRTKAVTMAVRQVGKRGCCLFLFCSLANAFTFSSTPTFHHSHRVTTKGRLASKKMEVSSTAPDCLYSPRASTRLHHNIPVAKILNKEYYPLLAVCWFLGQRIWQIYANTHMQLLSRMYICTLSTACATSSEPHAWATCLWIG